MKSQNHRQKKFQTELFDTSSDRGLNGIFGVSIKSEKSFKLLSSKRFALILFVIALFSLMFLNNVSASSLCYQESANTTNQTGIDGSCGLNYGGGYAPSVSWINSSFAFDGNFTTFATTTLGGLSFLINYSIPISASAPSILNKSILTFKDDGGKINISINSDFLNSTFQFNVSSIAVGGACPSFSPDTLIQTTSGEKRIDSIKVGDDIYSYNSSIQIDKVIGVVNHSHDEIYHIYTNFSSLTVDSLQKVYSNKQWIQAKDLKIGDNILNFDLKNEQIIEIVVETGSKMEMNDLEIKNNHNFFANNLLVHNCNSLQIEAWNYTSSSWETILGNRPISDFNFFEEAMIWNITDLTNPSINITVPFVNNTNTSNTNQNVNFTFSDSMGIDSAWYSNDTYAVNLSLGSGGTSFNITNITWSQGNHNVTIYVNDTSNNINFSTISFTVDNVPPSINVAEPQASKLYQNNNSLSLNFTVTDAINLVSSCWYNIINVNGTVAIANTTLTGCTNTTFSLPGNNLNYNLNFYSNDTLNNVGNKTVLFGIRTTLPAITLNSPTNNQFFNHTNNIYFNFTALDSSGLDTCQLYGNWSGIFALNFSWIKPTNNTMNSTSLNFSTDNSYIYNIFCNNTAGNGNFAISNFTLTMDTVKPNITILPFNTVAGSQTIQFNSTESDTNLDSCKYTIYNSLGNIDGLNSNVSFNCNQLTSATTTSFGIFNLTIYVNDSAGNENLASASFTVSQTSNPSQGGSGGTTSYNFVTVLALIQSLNDTGTYSNLSRAQLFSRINESCNSNNNCQLTSDQTKNLLDNLKSGGIIPQSINSWIEQYREGKIENVQVSFTDAISYRLTIAQVLIVPGIFQIVGSSNIDSFKFLIGDAPVIETILLNQIISNCSVNGDVGFSCTPQSSTTVVSYISPIELGNFNFKTVQTTISFVNKDGKAIYASITFRIIHLTQTVIIGSSIVVLAGIFVFIKRKDLSKFIGIKRR